LKAAAHRRGMREMLMALCGLLMACQTPAATQNSRQEFDFSGGWKMFVGDEPAAASPDFDDSGWKRVTLPRAINEDEPFKVDIKKLSTGISWYRKRFVLSAVAADSRVYLEFEGVRQSGEVFINGKSAYLGENGISAFGIEMSQLLRPAPAENVIAVRVDSDWKYRERRTQTPFQWNNDNFNASYGGINRGVRLHITGALHQTLPLYGSLGTTGVYVWADHFNIARKLATVHAETEVRNSGERPRTFEYRINISDAQDKSVAMWSGGRHSLQPGESRVISASARIRELEFWSWGYGYLYAVSTELLEDGEVVDRVITRTGFRKTEFKNGIIYLNDRAMMVHGYAQRTTNEWPALGVDVPPWISDFSNGLMVEGGANLVRWMHTAPSPQDVASADRVGLPQAMPAGDAESDVEGRRWEQRVEVMRDAIIRYRNRPSILFYECGNENISEAHMAEMKAVRDRFDPHGGRAIGSREMLDSRIAEYGGEMLYINKSAAKPVWAMEYSRDEGARAYQDEFTPPFHRDAPAYNRNQDSHAVENVARWYDLWRERPGSGLRVSAGGVNIIFSDSNTHYRGDNNYRRSGEVDAMRIPKQGFYVHQVMWDGWVVPERSRTHIIGHWNYAPGVVKNVQVVSNGERVELVLNGRSLGFGERRDGFLFVFKDVAYEAGTLRAITYNAADREASSMELRTAGPAAALRLTPHVSPFGWRADGADLALVDVEVVDAEGRRVPIATDLIRFDVEGPAEWRGGIAQGPGNYILERELPVEAGVNRVSLRSLETPGVVRITASAEGLASAVLTLDVRSPPPSNGVSPIRGDDLPVRLGRGPTPPGPAFRPWRTSVRIASAKAGSNDANARMSFDDNEASAWTSAGELANAWIEYDIGKSESLDAISLRLTGWRIRSYPLRVTIDGRTVYEGTPEKSLGYVTLPLRQARGRRLRILLTGKTEDRDAFGKIVEVTKARQGLDTGAERVKTGTVLSIVEAEIYR
jgi:beta-galactosidase